MDFSAALPTFIITLREGVEAALVVGIVLACLNKAGQNKLNYWVYWGVLIGIIASALVGVLLGGLLQSLSLSQSPYSSVLKPLLQGIFSLIAIGMLSWMLIWMTQQAKFLKTEVEGAVSSALQADHLVAGWGIFTLIFIAVLREGVETVLFIVAKFQLSLIPIIGTLFGLGIAGLIGVLLFKWGVKINLGQFFKFMGVLLLLIVAGLLLSALGNFDRAIQALSLINSSSKEFCFSSEHFTPIHSCILGPLVWDFHQILPDDQFPGLIFKTLLGYKDRLFLVQVITYVMFLVTVGTFYFQNLEGKPVLSSKNDQVKSQN